MKAVEEIKNGISGVAALHDWLGDSGQPVSKMVAEFRSHRCVTGDNGSPCPLNKEPNWWDRIKGVIADWIKKELEIKNDMNLQVSNEDQINMCAACGCCLRLKVWVPTEHVRKHTTKAQLAKMPAYCWIKKELKYGKL